MRKDTKNKWSLFGVICIVLEITSFSNHPNWGNGLTLFGAALVSLMVFKKVKA